MKSKWFGLKARGPEIDPLWQWSLMGMENSPGGLYRSIPPGHLPTHTRAHTHRHTRTQANGIDTRPIWVVSAMRVVCHCLNTHGRQAFIWERKWVSLVNAILNGRERERERADLSQHGCLTYELKPQQVGVCSSFLLLWHKWKACFNKCNSDSFNFSQRHFKPHRTAP